MPATEDLSRAAFPQRRYSSYRPFDYRGISLGLEIGQAREGEKERERERERRVSLKGTKSGSDSRFRVSSEIHVGPRTFSPRLRISLDNSPTSSADESVPDRGHVSRRLTQASSMVIDRYRSELALWKLHRV